MKYDEVVKLRLTELEITRLRCLQKAKAASEAGGCLLFTDVEELAALEGRHAAADQALRKYEAQPACPFCHLQAGRPSWKMEEKPTKGRLECESCGALALVGYCTVEVK